MKDEHITLRYSSNKMQVESLNVSRFHHQLTRKESADSNKTESFKYAKYLPRLQTREHPYKRVNISSDMKKMPEPDKSDFFSNYQSYTK